MAFLPHGISLSDLSESAKQKVALEIKKAVERQVKKELAKRRKKFARKLAVMGVTFTIGCVLYAFSDRIVDMDADRAFDAAASRRKRKKLESGKKHR